MKLFHLLLIVSLVFCSEFHYDENGADWADNEWQCLSGSSQSPINIDVDLIPLNEQSHLTLKKAANVSDIPIVNNGHSIQADYPWLEFEATNIQGENKYYKAVQLHFHSPSEHSFNNELVDLEVHIVCDQIDGPENGLPKGVFTFIFKEGAENPMIEPFSQAAKSLATEKTVLISPNLYENMNKVLNEFEQLTYFTYQGSLTTPPCTQIVEWHILKQALPISTAQLQNFKDLWGNNQEFAEGKGNNRVVQALNGRTIIQGQAWNKLEVFARIIVPFSLITFILIFFLILF